MAKEGSEIHQIPDIGKVTHIDAGSKLQTIKNAPIKINESYSWTHIDHVCAIKLERSLFRPPPPQVDVPCPCLRTMS